MLCHYHREYIYCFSSGVMRMFENASFMHCMLHICSYIFVMRYCLSPITPKQFLALSVYEGIFTLCGGCVSINGIYSSKSKAFFSFSSACPHSQLTRVCEEERPHACVHLCKILGCDAALIHNNWLAAGYFQIRTATFLTLCCCSLQV